jgi:cell division protein FtsB
MDFNVKNIKLFATEEERRAIEQKQLELDSDFGNPENELAVMYRGTKWGIHFFAAITLLSTMALIYRVTCPHLIELIGVILANIISLGIAFGAALAVEVMLRGNWEPFCKKIFVTGRLDVVLGGMGILFTGIILYGAITGMEIIAETNQVQPEIESVAKSSESINSTINANKKEIEELRNGKGKGIYAWKGKPTPQANKRIKELESQNTQALGAITSLSTATEKANATKVELFSDKAKKAVHYLSILALGAEIIKLIIFIFWGYRSMQLKSYRTGGVQENEKTVEQPKKIEKTAEFAAPTPAPIAVEKPVKNETPPPPSGGAGMGNGKATSNSDVAEHRKAMNYRSTLKTRFKKCYTEDAFDLDALIEQWETNEMRIERICGKMNMPYTYCEVPEPMEEN